MWSHCKQKIMNMEIVDIEYIQNIWKNKCKTSLGFQSFGIFRNYLFLFCI